MAICDAAGPIASTCFAPSSVVTSRYELKFWMTPCDTSSSASTIESGNRIQRMQRVRSTQKLPRSVVLRRTKPRISTSTTTMPTAAETKFCTVNASICDR